MIEIVESDPSWPAAFEAEAARIRNALAAMALRIDHHGSTAVPGLRAKPVIDIQVSVAALDPRCVPFFTARTAGPTVITSMLSSTAGLKNGVRSRFATISAIIEKPRTTTNG